MVSRLFIGKFAMKFAIYFIINSENNNYDNISEKK